MREPKPGSAAADGLDVLAALVADYESRHWPIEPLSDPVEAIRFRMDQRGYTHSAAFSDHDRAPARCFPAPVA
jgi:antitoxin component HigA of HigAB toxin-antitoxin module